MSAHRELPAELSIYTAAETHAQMLQWLDADPEPGAWPVAAQAVAQADAAGVQLLVALQRSLHERGQQLALNEPSQVLARACDSLGLSSLMAR